MLGQGPAENTVPGMRLGPTCLVSYLAHTLKEVATNDVAMLWARQIGPWAFFRCKLFLAPSETHLLAFKSFARLQLEYASII